jgi:hypothetical protein
MVNDRGGETSCRSGNQITLNDKDPLLQASWAKDSLIAKVLSPSAQEEADARLVVWDIVLIQG